MICLANKVTLTLPKTTDPPDIEVINTALRQLANAVNTLVDENNKQLTYESNTDGFMTVEVVSTTETLEESEG